MVRRRYRSMLKEGVMMLTSGPEELTSANSCRLGLIFAEHVLVVNPGVRFFQTLPQGNVGLPSQIFLDERIVAVPAHHALGCVQIVDALQLDLGDILHD